jgi:hypothetical protein
MMVALETQQPVIQISWLPFMEALNQLRPFPIELLQAGRVENGTLSGYRCRIGGYWRLRNHSRVRIQCSRF